VDIPTLLKFNINNNILYGPELKNLLTRFKKRKKLNPYLFAQRRTVL